MYSIYAVTLNDLTPQVQASLQPETVSSPLFVGFFSPTSTCISCERAPFCVMGEREGGANRVVDGFLRSDREAGTLEQAQIIDCC